MSSPEVVAGHRRNSRHAPGEARLPSQRDEVTSIHEVAPLDVRAGWTERTDHLLYVWAWCYAEDKAEMHLLDRVEAVVGVAKSFDPQVVLAEWTRTAWPLPDEWEVSRDW